MEFKVMKSADACGTGLAGYVEASYADLVRAFGEPTEGDGYKVSTEWIFEAPDRRVVTLYDYKETNLSSPDLPSVDEFRARASYRWHVGSSGVLVAPFAEWLRGQLAVGEPCAAPIVDRYENGGRFLLDEIDAAEEEPTMTLDDIEDERDAVESSTPLVEDATELREALVDLFERSDEFEFPQIKRLQSFEDAAIMTCDEGIVITFVNGKKFQLTIVEDRRE